MQTLVTTLSLAIQATLNQDTMTQVITEFEIQRDRINKDLEAKKKAKKSLDKAATNTWQHSKDYFQLLLANGAPLALIVEQFYNDFENKDKDYIKQVSSAIQFIAAMPEPDWAMGLSKAKTERTKQNKANAEKERLELEEKEKADKQGNVEPLPIADLQLTEMEVIKGLLRHCNTDELIDLALWLEGEINGREQQAA